MTQFIAPPPGVIPAPAPSAPQPGPAPPNPNQLPVDIAVDKYRQLRDREAEIKARHAQELAPFRAAMDAIEVSLMESLQNSGAKSVATAHGTAYLSTKKSFKIEDPAAFRQWCEANGKLDMYENRVSKEALETYLADGGAMPPGVKESGFTTVNVRKN